MNYEELKLAVKNSLSQGSYFEMDEIETISAALAVRGDTFYTVLLQVSEGDVIITPQIVENRGDIEDIHTSDDWMRLPGDYSSVAEALDYLNRNFVLPVSV